MEVLPPCQDMYAYLEPPRSDVPGVVGGGAKVCERGDVT